LIASGMATFGYALGDRVRGLEQRILSHMLRHTV